MTDPAQLVAHVREQAEGCAEMGSALYACLLAKVAEDIESGGPAADVLADVEGDPRAAAVALRLMGGVHRIVLERRAPGLAVFYPSVGGTADASPDGSVAWPALRAVLRNHLSELRALLAQAPQTNEVGRAAALVGGLQHIRAWRDAPVRLAEIGASAGLNLWADLFRVESVRGAAVGPADSPVRLTGAWKGAEPPAGPVRVVERLGCDPAPLDPRTTEGRLRLTSYVWPDQTHRLERLRGALTLAADRPFVVRQQRAAAFLRDLRLVPGTTTVLWHSVMWQYLPAEEQAEAGRLVAGLGADATDDAGFAHVSLEPSTRGRPDGYAFLVRLRTWPPGTERLLGTAHPHGVPTTWA